MDATEIYLRAQEMRARLWDKVTPLGTCGNCTHFEHKPNPTADGHCKVWIDRSEPISAYQERAANADGCPRFIAVCPF